MVKTYKLALIFFLSFAPLYIHAATLSISPASGSFEVGDRVTMRVVVSSDAPLNAISGTVAFPTNLFSIDSVSKAGSLLNFWVSEPGFSSAGELHFEGVTLGGYPGGSGTVITVTLHALRPGSGTVSFKSGTVLANDGQGTDITDGIQNASFSVVVGTNVEKPSLPVPAPELPQPPPSLNAPEINLVRQFGEAAINGISPYPNAQVLLTFIDNSGSKIFITGETESNGQFLLLVPRTLKHGSYRVTAQIIKKDLSHSPPSNEIVVEIGNIFSDISGEIKISLILLLVLLIALFIRGYFYFNKNKNLKKIIKSESREAEEITRKSFKLLNDDLDNLVDRSQSTEDKKYIRGVSRDMSEAEDLILKEIKDVETL